MKQQWDGWRRISTSPSILVSCRFLPAQREKFKKKKKKNRNQEGRNGNSKQSSAPTRHDSSFYSFLSSLSILLSFFFLLSLSLCFYSFLEDDAKIKPGPTQVVSLHRERCEQFRRIYMGQRLNQLGFLPDNSCSGSIRVGKHSMSHFFGSFISFKSRV